jgi:serine/threonine protein kinase
VSNFRKLSRIGEGTYGYVYKACSIQSLDSSAANSSSVGTPTDDSKGIVALKRIKMHNEHQDGFPLTCLREIKTLRRCSGHENIVTLLDIVVGRNRDAVFLLFEYCEHDLVNIMFSHVVPPVLSIHPSIYISIYLFIYPSMYVCMYSNICMYVSSSPSIPSLYAYLHKQNVFFIVILWNSSLLHFYLRPSL